ncbi:MAG: hypothetical protein ABSG15_07420, partial [FCB group bacterium]
MKNLYFIKCLTILLLFFLSNGLNAQVDTAWTVTALDNPAPGYLRFDWNYYANFFLVDNYGIKNYVDTNNQRLSIYCKLLRNGLWISGASDKYYLFTQDMKLF